MRPNSISVVHTGRPKAPILKCGCLWNEQPGGMHHGRGIWTLRYDWTPCKKHGVTSTTH